MGIISKRFFVSNIPSKVPITLITIPSNCFNWRLLSFSISVCLFSPRSFSLLKWHHCPYQLACEKYAIQLYFSLVLIGVFIAYISAFSVYSILSNLLYLHTTWKGSFFFQYERIFPPRLGNYSYFSYIPCPNTYIYSETWLCGDLGINKKTPNRMLTRRLSHTKCINESLRIGSTHPSGQQSKK